MKTFKLIGVALLTVLMSVGFSTCGGSDDDDNNGGGGGGETSTSIEGTWTVKSQKWYKWDKTNNAPDMSKVTYESTDADTWILTKSGDNYNFRQIYTDRGKTYEETSELIHVTGNEYKMLQNGKIKDRLVFKSITANSMTAEYTENYYGGDEAIKEFGILYLSK